MLLMSEVSLYRATLLQRRGRPSRGNALGRTRSLPPQNHHTALRGYLAHKKTPTYLLHLCGLCGPADACVFTDEVCSSNQRRRCTYRRRT